MVLAGPRSGPRQAKLMADLASCCCLENRSFRADPSFRCDLSFSRMADRDRGFPSTSRIIGAELFSRRREKFVGHACRGMIWVRLSHDGMRPGVPSVWPAGHSTIIRPDSWRGRLSFGHLTTRTGKPASGRIARPLRRRWCFMRRWCGWSRAVARCTDNRVIVRTRRRGDRISADRVR